MHPALGDVRLAARPAAPEASSTETEDEGICERRGSIGHVDDARASESHGEHGRKRGGRGNKGGGTEACGQGGRGGSKGEVESGHSRQYALWQIPGAGNLRVRFSVGRGGGKKSREIKGGKGSKKEKASGLEGSKSASVGVKRSQAGEFSKRVVEMERGVQSSSTDTDEDGELIQRAMKAKEAMLQRQRESKASAPKKRSKGGAVRPGTVNLKLLIDEGILTPGQGVLSLEYRGIRETADLHPDGRIQWKDNSFDSPSAFSIFIKRLVNPTRKADDGWKTVKFGGSYLDHYKLVLAKKRSEIKPASGSNASPMDVALSSKEPNKRQRAEVTEPASETANGGKFPVTSPSDKTRSVFDAEIADSPANHCTSTYSRH